MRLAAAALATAALSAGAPALADFDAAILYMRRGAVDLAYPEFRKAAEAGDVMAARALGSMLHSGVEVQGGSKVAARPEEAVKWYRVGAEGGDRISARMLGLLLAVGRGTQRDAGEALRWFGRAGMKVEPVRESLASYPPADQDEIAAWCLAMRVAIRREMEVRKPRDFTAGAVTVAIEAEGGRVEVVESDVSAPTRDMAEEIARRALVFAPPPPAAVLHRFRMHQSFNFLNHP